MTKVPGVDVCVVDRRELTDLAERSLIIRSTHAERVATGLASSIVHTRIAGARVHRLRLSCKRGKMYSGTIACSVTALRLQLKSLCVFSNPNSGY